MTRQAVSPNGPPQHDIANGQFANVVACAAASGEGRSQVIRAATGFIGAHGDGGRQNGRIRAGFGEGLI